MCDSSAPKIAILLGTYNGALFLQEQLDSFVDQTYTNWQVFASDDGSQDNTIPILEAFQKTYGIDKLIILRGPQKGFSTNFLSMVCNPIISADYYAFSDQDDIWESDKLARAVNCLQKTPVNQPALYCTRTCLVDRNNKEIGFSSLHSKPPSFLNALTQNIASGNTMIFNKGARTLLRKAGNDFCIPMHDWWLYLAVTAVGGHVYCDNYFSVRYRQHSGNLIGENQSVKAKAIRISLLLKGRLRDWTDRHTHALSLIREELTVENQKYFDQLCCARNATALARVFGLIRLKLYRQSLFDNIGFYMAIIFNKV